MVVVGGGAAGILAAWNAARLGARTLLIEKTERLGTKILISGGGKCNLAHDGPLEDVIRAFRPNEARFLRPACYRLPNHEIIRMFVDRGLEVYTRPDGRVFPVDRTAKDVVDILESYLRDTRVVVWRETPVHDICAHQQRITGVNTARGEVQCPRVVLSVGGASYPKTGSTGDGYPWLRALGHTVVPIRAALAPAYMELDGTDPRAGIALRDIVLKARIAGKEISRWRGDLLFTHRGVSGPAVLGLTRVVAQRFAEGPVTLEVQLAPDRTFEAWSEMLGHWRAEHPRRLITAFLEEQAPARLAEDLLSVAKIENRPASTLGKRDLNRLIGVLQAWPLGKVRAVPMEKGEVVAGGVELDEVEPHTMRSRLCSGLYLCGEILDIAGPVGGYNLQAAFATGFVAGESAARDALS